MKIYDCTMFFDEKMMFEVRLNILDKFIDKFVVVESLYAHSGVRKKQNFNIDDYKKFKLETDFVFHDSPKSDMLQFVYSYYIDENYTWKPTNSIINYKHTGQPMTLKDVL